MNYKDINGNNLQYTANNYIRGFNKIFPAKGFKPHNPNLYCQMYNAFVHGFECTVLTKTKFSKVHKLMNIIGSSLHSYESQWKK